MHIRNNCGFTLNLVETLLCKMVRTFLIATGIYKKGKIG
jgi:hypothetical protein